MKVSPTTLIVASYDNVGRAYLKWQYDKARKYCKKAVEITNPTGKGTISYQESSDWNQYSKVAIEKMLALRFKSTGIDHSSAVG